MKSKLPMVAIALLLINSSTQAEQKASDASNAMTPVELSPVTVHAETLPASALTHPDHEAQHQALQSVPGGTSLIEETRFKTGRTATITDMLQGQPGIFTGSRGGGDEAKLSIRGSGIDRNYHLRGIRLLQDGIPMSMADGNTDFQWLEPFAISNIEVYRGGNGLQYSASTLGGAIHFISPTGYTASGIQGRIETGSYGALKGQISSGMAIGKLDYYVSGTASYQNGFQAHSRSQAQRYSANIGYRFNPDTETRFYGGFVHSKLQLPGSLTRRELYHRPRSTAPNSLDFDEQHNVTQTYLANKTVRRFGDTQQLEASVYWIHHRLDHPLFWNPFFLNGLGVLDQHTHTIGTHWRYTDSQERLGHRNELTLGILPQFSRMDEKRFQNLSGRKRGLKTAHSKPFSGTIDLYAENRHYLRRDLALVLGSQLSYAARNYHDRFNRNPNGNQTRNQNYLGINPKAGLLYNITPTTQVYANYSRSYEPPTMLEVSQLGGVAGNIVTRRLKAQSAHTLEFGTRGTIKKLAWDTTFYRSWVRNELLTLNDALGNPQGTRNGSPTIHQGVEAGLSVVLAEGLFAKARKRDEPLALTALGPGLNPQTAAGRDRLILRQVYDWSHLRFRNDPVYGRNALPGLPPHLYRSELIYQHPSGFYIQPNLEWSAAKFSIDYANSLKVNPYTVFGVRTGYRSRRGWSAFVEFRNLANKRYASAVQVVADARNSSAPRAFSSGQGFSVYGGLELRW